MQIGLQGAKRAFDWVIRDALRAAPPTDEVGISILVDGVTQTVMVRRSHRPWAATGRTRLDEGPFQSIREALVEPVEDVAVHVSVVTIDA